MFAILYPEAVVVTNEHLDKEKAITSLVNLACKVYEIGDSSEILDNVIDRESKLSTGIGLEVAVPHCRSYQVTHSVLAVMLARQGVEYNSIDGKPVKLLVLIISPEKDITGHLSSLSAISNAVSNESIRTRMLNSQTISELYRYLSEIH